MANKILTIAGNNEPSLSSIGLLVYADVNLNASLAQVQLKSIYSDPSSSHSFLSQDPDSDPKSYVLQDSDNSHIVLQTQLDHLNIWNSKYNDQQRKKSHYKLEKNINLIAIKRAIKNIFTWIPGERILNPEFGSKLRNYLYEGITSYNQEQIMAEIRHCFAQWEPRAVLDKVINLTDVSDREDNTVRMEIVYSVPSLDAKQISYVYEYQKPV